MGTGEPVKKAWDLKVQKIVDKTEARIISEIIELFDDSEELLFGKFMEYAMSKDIGEGL